MFAPDELKRVYAFLFWVASVFLLLWPVVSVALYLRMKGELLRLKRWLAIPAILAVAAIEVLVVCLFAEYGLRPPCDLSLMHFNLPLDLRYSHMFGRGEPLLRLATLVAFIVLLTPICLRIVTDSWGALTSLPNHRGPARPKSVLAVEIGALYLSIAGIIVTGSLTGKRWIDCAIVTSAVILAAERLYAKRLYGLRWHWWGWFWAIWFLWAANSSDISAVGRLLIALAVPVSIAVAVIARRETVKGYFGLSCPKCGSGRTKFRSLVHAKFLRCPVCKHEWELGAEPSDVAAKPTRSAGQVVGRGLLVLGVVLAIGAIAYLVDWRSDNAQSVAGNDQRTAELSVDELLLCVKTEKGYELPSGLRESPQAHLLSLAPGGYRMGAVMELQNRGKLAAAAVPELVSLMTDRREDPMLRGAIGQLLAEIAPPDQIMPLLWKILDDGKECPAVREQALFAVIQNASDSETTRRLLDLGRNEAANPDLRMHAVSKLRQLGVLKDKDVVPILVGIVRSKNGSREVMKAAVDDLGKIGPAAREAVPALADLYRDSDVPSDNYPGQGVPRSRILKALRKILAEQGADRSRAAPPLSPRIWTDDTGKHKVEAAFIDMKDEKVRLIKANGNIFTVSIERLSKEDQQFIRDPNPGTGPAAAGALEEDNY